jgi:hypothetical protein
MKLNLVARRTAVAAVALLGLMGCRDHNATATSTDTPPKAAPPAAAPAHSAFDAARAFEHVKRQVAFGPRPAGSPALAETRKYIEGELKSYGLAVHEEPFTAETPVGKVDMVNVVAELPGASPDLLLITSHYDTKRLKDFVGANDGGSSTGALLEIARVVAEGAKTQKPDMTIDFVFFDGEEAVIEWQGTDNTYGSRHYVDAHKADGTLAKVRGMVLLDMIGDRDLDVHRELNSTRSLVDVIWQTAASLGYAKQFPNTSYEIEDDHIPFLTAGIASVDLIDFQYGTDNNFGPGGPNNAYWHSPADTLDKCSPDSLKAVGDTVVASLPKLMATLKR